MIRVDHDGGVASVVLDRPEARNAISMAGWHALARCFDELATSAARVVVVRSAVPGVFSAGADLVELARLADRPAERAPFRLAMRAAIDALAGLPMPTITCIDGGCHGAGVALALAADLRVATPIARFAIPPARLGISYPAEDVARLIARVGRAQAAMLLFTAAPIDAHEALRIGLVDRLACGEAVAGAIAANDADAVRSLKRVLVDPDDATHAAGFDTGFASPAFREGTARYRR